LVIGDPSVAQEPAVFLLKQGLQAASRASGSVRYRGGLTLSRQSQR
jgi:hypothetical protein